MLMFDQIDCLINKSGIMADSASIGNESSVKPVAALGRRGIIGYSNDGGLRNTFDFSYTLDLNSEPNAAIAETIKNDFQNFHYEPIQLVVAGITGSGYLDSYSIKISPNDLGRANASYISFIPITGVLQEKNNNISYNVSGYSGLAHGWTTHLYSSKQGEQIPIYELSYNFKADWQPVYKIGQTNPAQVQLMGISEEIDLVRDIFRNVSFSGDDSKTFLEMTKRNDVINFDSLANDHGNGQTNLTLNIKNAKVKSTQVEAENENFVRVRTRMNKYY